jgi:sensor histidine kinase YesM
VSYIPLFRSKSQIKYYLIVGAFVLFITSITAELIFRLDLVKPGNQISFSIFYIGILIENMFFSLGLGQKQKLILKEKNESQEKLIYQLRENEALKEKINQQLAHEVNSLNKQVEIDKLDSINANYEKELAELKITLLRSQMNPHFIFNSLNSIKLYIINNEKENAVYYLNKFSKLIRKILASTRVKEVSLADELETMSLYMNIENIRFENKIDYKIDVDENVNIETIKMPCMILQPLIENSIWHGLSSKNGSKKIRIMVSQKSKNFIDIVIEDNGIGRKAASSLSDKKLHKQKSLGLKLAKERLLSFYKDFDNHSKFKIIDLYDEDEQAAGTQVQLKIPLV